MATLRMAACVALVAFLLSVLAGYMYEEGEGVTQSDPQAFAPDRNDPVASQCDLLANAPSDPQRVGSGVELEKIDVGEALPVCLSATERRPFRPRYLYLYGRVLDAAKRYTEATAQYAAADQGGYARATAALGGMYEAGLGVSPDLAKAASLYQRAGDAGDADAYARAVALHLRATPPNYVQAYALSDRAARAGSHWGTTFLGEFYFFGLGVTKDQARGISLFRQAADRGNSSAMFHLGLAYFAGQGVQQDKPTALGWITRAADLGILQAQNLAGTMYDEGDGVTRSDEQAIAWYRKSAAQGDAFGMTHLGMLLSVVGKGAEAVELYRKAAALGFVDAYLQLGVDYNYGDDGLLRDPAQAEVWYGKAAEKGSSLAMFRLARLYENGDAFPRDPARVAFWYGKAAEKGDRFSMIALGELYERGEGVPRNLDRARQLYMQVAGNLSDGFGQDATYHLARLNGAVGPAAPGDVSPPPQPTIVPQENTPDPPRRPLPTEPSLSDGEKAAGVVVGAAFAYGFWQLLFGSGSEPEPEEPSDPGTPYYPWADEGRRQGECASYLRC